MFCVTNIMSSDKVGILDPKGEHKNPLNDLDYSDNYRELAQKWSKLPAYEKADEVINTIKKSKVTLVISGTGSGKTVLVPKFALHALGYDKHIAITLPKKMISKSAAEYAAATLDVKVGEHVGYQYRGSDRSAKSDDARLLYCTDGTLVSRLMTDPKLQDYDCAIIDEAHERKVNIDLLLYLLRNVVHARPDFRLIIMSATIDKSIFERYYGNDLSVLEISGKTNYPIESIYLSESIGPDKYIQKGLDIIKDIISSEPKSDDPVGILFFVTSVNETIQACRVLDSLGHAQQCISVYSGMDADRSRMATDQEYFITNSDTNTKFKILISTNVAESSLTVEGIKYVIDSGLELKSMYDHKNRIHKLHKQYITRSQVKQRIGRTGRTGPGIAHHLYTEEDYNNMDMYPDPAIKTESLTIDVLRLLNFDSVQETSKLKDLLQEFIEPPPADVVEYILHDLEKLEMIEADEITPIGRICVKLQLEPRQVRSLIMGYKLHCYREMLAIICVAEEIAYSMQSLFVPPKNVRNKDMTRLERKKVEQSDANRARNIKSEYSNMYGDHLSLLKIFSTYDKLRSSDKSSSEIMKILDKGYLRKKTLDNAYKNYRKLRYTTFDVFKTAAEDESTKNLFETKLDRGKILSENMNIRILACLHYGSKDYLIKTNGKTAQIEVDNVAKTANVDRDSLIQKKSKPNKAVYEILFQYDPNRPIKVKIVTYVSAKSIELLDKL